jgi:hypothetical protein
VFVGHLGAGLAAKAVEPRLGLGALFGAALFADLALWGLVLAGVESVGPPVVAGGARFFTFAFPWSHGALASVAWSALAGALAWGLAGPRTPRRHRLAATIAAAVASHFVLDASSTFPTFRSRGPARRCWDSACGARCPSRSPSRSRWRSRRSRPTSSS